MLWLTDSHLTELSVGSKWKSQLSILVLCIGLMRCIKGKKRWCFQKQDIGKNWPLSCGVWRKRAHFALKVFGWTSAKHRQNIDKMNFFMLHGRYIFGTVWIRLRMFGVKRNARIAIAMNDARMRAGGEESGVHTSEMEDSGESGGWELGCCVWVFSRGVSEESECRAV